MFYLVTSHLRANFNMADEKAAEARKKAEELDQEIDEFMESLQKKSNGKKREIDFKEENWEEVKN